MKMVCFVLFEVDKRHVHIFNRLIQFFCDLVGNGTYSERILACRRSFEKKDGEDNVRKIRAYILL